MKLILFMFWPVLALLFWALINFVCGITMGVDSTSTEFVPGLLTLWVFLVAPILYTLLFGDIES